MKPPKSYEIMKITAYGGRKYKKAGKSYEVMLNPSSYTHQFEVEYNHRPAAGSPDARLKYKGTPPSTISFDLILDGSGVVDPEKTDLVKEVSTLKSIVYDYQGKNHCPNYLEIAWGVNTPFRCRLTSMSISYTHFKSDGSPLRAKVSLSFKGNAKLQTKRNQSPDMTHAKSVVAGDMLPALTYEVYADEAYLLELAAFNELDNLLYLEPGKQLVFPPLKGQADGSVTQN